ncbi:hypothetical protein GCM10009743_16330 [Kribbella swartbergensis]
MPVSNRGELPVRPFHQKRGVLILLGPRFGSTAVPPKHQSPNRLGRGPIKMPLLTTHPSHTRTLTPAAVLRGVHDRRPPGGHYLISTARYDPDRASAPDYGEGGKR